tara:strand:+ start:602 stop:886 length:285 start_codon:yes stop_codon:yes gene_type:complete
MTDREYLNLALAQMHSGQWFGWKKDWTGSHRESYENIIVHDSSITKPTESEVNAKIQELKDSETATANAKTSGKAKLKAGEALSDAEIKALFGA